MKKTILTILLLTSICSVAFAKEGLIQDVKISSGKLQIRSIEKVKYSVVVPEEKQFMYVDIENMKIVGTTTRLMLAQGQGFDSVRIGRHTNPSMIRFVLHAPDNSPIPLVSVQQQDNVLTLAWSPLLARQIKQMVQEPKKLKPRGITKVKNDDFFKNLVERVKGAPINPPKVAYAGIDASAPIKQNPTFEVIDEEKSGLLDDFWEGISTIVNDTKAFLVETYTSIASMFNTGGEKFMAFFTSESVAHAGDSFLVKVNDTAEKQKIKVVHEQCDSKAACKAKTIEDTDPNVPDPEPKQKQNYALEADLQELRIKIDTSYRKAIKEARNFALKETSTLKTVMSKEISASAEKIAKKAVTELIKQYQAKLNQLQQQQIEVSQLLAEIKSQRDKIDLSMKNLNARNGALTCREEPTEGYRVVFLPAGSLRSGLESLAESANLKLVWEAPRGDYYINSAIMLNGMTFEENLMVIHSSLAQNNVYFALEPNYSKAKLRVRAREVHQQEDRSRKVEVLDELAMND